MCCLINYYDSLLSLFILNYTSREHQDTHALHLNNQLLMWSKHPLECICIIQLFMQFSVMNALQYLCISKHAHCMYFSQEPSFILYNYTGNVHDYATRAQCNTQSYSSLRLKHQQPPNVCVTQTAVSLVSEKLLHIFSLFFCILNYCSYICCRQMRLKVCLALHFTIK